MSKKDHFIKNLKTSDEEMKKHMIRCEYCVYATTEPDDFPCNECKHLDLESNQDD